MNTRRMHTHLFLILASLFLLMVLVAMTGCSGPAIEESTNDMTDGNSGTESGLAAEISAAGPVETTEAFYAWYFDYIGEPGSDSFRNPLADRAYADSEYLSARLVQEVDDLKNEEYGGFPYDPFLQAQDFPLETTVEAWEESDDEATVIVHQLWGENVRDLTVDLIMENNHWLIDRIRRGNPTTPEGTAELFYRWYLDYIGDPDSGTFKNPLVDRAYQGSEYLSERFIQKVDEVLASAAGGGYDPILQAQDVPETVRVGDVVTSGDQAVVTVDRYWGGNATASPMEVALEKVGGRWLITDVSVPGQAPALLPAEVVEAFYAQWRLAVRGDMRSSEGSPLAEGAYHNSDFLTEDFKKRVDELVSGMGPGGYDPFLCAQDVPNEITPATTFMGPQAHVLVTTDFNGHAFTVVLALEGEGGWKIDDVVCANTPVGATTAFYTWYLGFPGDPLSSTSRSPLAENAYRQAPFLSDALVKEIDALLEEMRKTPAGYDPFLQAQEYANDFSVSPMEAADQVQVKLFFGSPLYGSSHTLHVGLVEQEGRWLLRSIEPAEKPTGEEGALERALATLTAEAKAPTGEMVGNEEFGFQFQIPVDWVAQPMDMDAPGMPDDWPVEAGYLIMPATLAEKMTAQTGPPSASAAILVAPFSVEVVLGEQAAYDRAFVPALRSGVTVIGGMAATVAQVGQTDTTIRYTFHSEEGQTRWVVFHDLVSGFPARAEQAAAVSGILPGILSTFAFTE